MAPFPVLSFTSATPVRWRDVRYLTVSLCVSRFKTIVRTHEEDLLSMCCCCCCYCVLLTRVGQLPKKKTIRTGPWRFTQMSYPIPNSRFNPTSRNHPESPRIVRNRPESQESLESSESYWIDRNRSRPISVLVGRHIWYIFHFLRHCIARTSAWLIELLSTQATKWAWYDRVGCWCKA